MTKSERVELLKEVFTDEELACVFWALREIAMSFRDNPSRFLLNHIGCADDYKYLSYFFRPSFIALWDEEFGLEYCLKEEEV